jgi:hypothetical protein
VFYSNIIGIKTSGTRYNKDGVSDLPEKDHDSALMLLENMNEYGIFAVPVGALEQWLPELNVPSSKHGSDWLMDAFEKMGTNPEESTYCKPEENGVVRNGRGVRVEFLDEIIDRHLGIPIGHEI